LLVSQRQGMQDTLTKVEELLNQKLDTSLSINQYTTADVTFLSNMISKGDFLKSPDAPESAQIHEAILHLQRLLNKFRLRSRMFEDVAAIYRVAYVSSLNADELKARL
jgi:hypothetical protein